MLIVVKGFYFKKCKQNKKKLKSTGNGSRLMSGGENVDPCVGPCYHKLVMQGSIQGKQAFLERKSGIV